MTLLRGEVLPILHHRAAAAVHGAGIVDGVTVLVIGSQRNAVLQPFVHAHRGLVVLVVGFGFLVVEEQVAGVGACAGGQRARRKLHVEVIGARTVVAEIHHDAQRQRLLQIEVPRHDVGKAVVGIESVVADGSGRGKSVGQREARAGLRAGRGRRVADRLLLVCSLVKGGWCAMLVAKPAYSPTV